MYNLRYLGMEKNLIPTEKSLLSKNVRYGDIERQLVRIVYSNQTNTVKPYSRLVTLHKHLLQQLKL